MNQDDAIQYVKSLREMPKSAESNETYCLSAIEEPGDETQHTPMQKRILQELIALRKLQKFHLQENQTSCDQLLSIRD